MFRNSLDAVVKRKKVLSLMRFEARRFGIAGCDTSHTFRLKVRCVLTLPSINEVNLISPFPVPVRSAVAVQCFWPSPI
jgi:hypothetical protein